MAAVSDLTVEADLARLEAGIKQLKVQYDMFLAGALPRQPIETRERVERLIKQYSHAAMRKYRHRFHFNGLVARYNVLSELWGKNLRAREEGARPAPAVVDRADKRTPPPDSYHLSGSGGDEPALRRLHASFLEARKKSGESASVPFDAFARKVAAQAESLRRKSGCEKVELRLEISDSKVLLKARPGR